MYKINEYVIYKHDTCRIKEIKIYNNTEYYTLSPIDDETLIIKTPTDNKMNYLRSIISKEDAEKLIENIPNISPLENLNDKILDVEYKELLNTFEHENLIKIIKTAYIRNEKRINNKMKISEKDNTYFNLAEKYLYNELSISLNKNIDEIREIIAKNCD